MSKTTVTTKVNEAGIRELLRSAGVQADVERRAQAVLEEARRTAPVDSGEYRDGLHIERTTSAAGVEVLTVTDGTDHGIYVEADHGTLVRALDAARDA